MPQSLTIVFFCRNERDVFGFLDVPFEPPVAPKEIKENDQRYVSMESKRNRVKRAIANSDTESEEGPPAGKCCIRFVKPCLALMQEILHSHFFKGHTFKRVLQKLLYI